MNCNDLNTKYGIKGILEFSEKTESFIIATIKNRHAEATIALQGAHVMTYQPHGEKPVIWLSEEAKFAPGKSIRGGVPVCWPWFGPHATNPEFPAHGFARTVNWQVLQTSSLADGSTFISFVLPMTEAARKQWPHESKAEMHITIGAALKVELITTGNNIVIGEALHTYLAVSDIGKISITGLENCEFMDKVGTPSRKVQQGAITFAGEVDRVYLHTPGDCLIEDRDWQRKIRISKEGSLSTIVWNPWSEKADKMGDLGPDGYRKMVCVESGNALDNLVTVKGEHRLVAIYSTEKI